MNFQRVYALFHTEKSSFSKACFKISKTLLFQVWLQGSLSKDSELIQ